MTIAALRFIASAMQELGINYAYMEMAAAPNYPYFVGEYSESEPTSEDGLTESTFLVTGFTRGSWEELEETKAAIAAYFGTTGRTLITEAGSAAAVCYASSLAVQTETELKRMQITLKIKEWSVN